MTVLPFPVVVMPPVISVEVTMAVVMAVRRPTATAVMSSGMPLVVERGNVFGPTAAMRVMLPRQRPIAAVMFGEVSVVNDRNVVGNDVVRR
jgi:hypothetical protein